MAKKVSTLVACCAAVVLMLAAGEARGATAIDGRQPGHRHSTGRRHRAARKKAHRRHVAVYVCPMHPDIRSNAPGTCPKCLMELVRKGARPERRS
jgi:hypothetical protein